MLKREKDREEAGEDEIEKNNKRRRKKTFKMPKKKRRNNENIKGSLWGGGDHEMDHKTYLELGTTLLFVFKKPFTIDFPFQVSFELWKIEDQEGILEDEFWWNW